MLDVCRLKKIRDNIANYKTAEKVTLLAATKTIPPEEVEALFDAGIVTAGENRVQEFIAKYDKVSRPIDWQFIGRLQINKVKYIVDKVSLIQSVDSEKLAAEINKQACKRNIVMPVLLEVNMITNAQLFKLIKTCALTGLCVFFRKMRKKICMPKLKVCIIG